jgi:hypothetical protein
MERIGDLKAASGRWLVRWARRLAQGVLAGLILAAASAPAQDPGWRQLASGFDLGRFAGAGRQGGREIQVVVVRVDPGKWDLRLGLASETEGIDGLSAREWCQRKGFVAAINAGMFATDYLTHIGFLQHRDHFNNPRVSRYQSVAAFCPQRAGLPRFRIFDRDAPDFSMEAIRDDYHCIVQNLRLIKRPGQNRWEPQAKGWIEAALGEDSRGRALLIMSLTACSMHEFNQTLLDLPLDIVCAQHLEGGPEAQLYVSVGDVSLEIVGGYETRLLRASGLNAAWSLPNVIGVAARP